MTSPPTSAFRSREVLPFVVPICAGWSLGWFLREVQAGVLPYDVSMLVGSLAGQLSVVSPPVVLNGAMLGVLGFWVLWSWLLTRRLGMDLPAALRKDALSYLPLLALPSVTLVVDHESLAGLRCLLDPLFLIAVAAVGAWKAWHWTPALSPSWPESKRSSGWRVWVLFGASAIVFSSLSVLQFRSWNVPYVDSGYFEELMWNTLHGRLLQSSQFEHIFLGEHTQFVLLLLLPFYALWPSMDWLTILQSFTVVAGVFPVWWLAKDRWDNTRALWFVALYLLHPGIHFALAEMNYNTFRPETLIIPSVLFGVYFLERERWGWAALFGLLVLLNREDMGLIVAGAGIYLAVQKKRWWVGAGLVALSIGYVFLCMHVIIPHFNAQAQYARLGMFAGLGDTPGEIVAGAIQHPLTFLARFLQGSNVLYLSYLLLPLGLLCLGRPALVLMAAPAILAAMLTREGVQNSIYFHYHNAPFAILVAATPAGAAAIAARCCQWFRCHPRRAQAVALTFACSAAITATLVGSKTPLSFNFYFPRSSPCHYSVLYQRTAHTAVLERARSMVPKTSSIAATQFAATHFTHHRDCYPFAEDNRGADFILADVNARWGEGARQWLQRRPNGVPDGYEPVLAEDGVFLFRRVGSQ